MKKLALIPIFCFVSIFSFAQKQAELNQFLDKTDIFLGKYVINDKVDYDQIIKSPKLLDELVSEIADFNVPSLDMEQKKAFYINAYNILVIDGIVDNYPTKSPQEIKGFFDQKKHSVGTKRFTLNELEKKELIPDTEDARLHFVLVCGALGCPPIAGEAYRPETLDQQMDKRTKMALNDPNFIRVNTAKRTVGLSQIFDWYKSDFTKTGNTVLEYINNYRTKSIPKSYKKSFYTYDWSLNDISSTSSTGIESSQLSNVQAFTPSVLLKKGQFEVNNLNNLYTQTAIRDRAGDEVALPETQTFLTNLFQISYGISENSRINVGLDFMINSAYYDSEQNSPLNLFSPGDGFSRVALSGIGPRIKFTPFPKITGLSVQSTFFFPVAGNLESPRFTAHDRFTWMTQFFYDHAFSSKFRLFLEADFLYRIKRNENQLNFFRTPVTGVLSYFPEENTTLFFLLQHSPAFGNATNGFDTAFGQLRWFTQYGIGGKYQLSSKLGLEISYSDFFLSRGDGAGNAYNLGFRYIY